MAVGAYEGLVGWRYILRRRRRPQVLVAGLAVLLLGAALFGAGAWMHFRTGAELSVFGNAPGTAQTLMGVGGGVVAFGFCLSLFGALNTFLTVFSAFSAFMVTIGVAEVILVLGVMNGFQGDLRAKIIDTYAHVVVEPGEAGAHIEDYRALTARIRGVEGVVGATPTLRTEVMISAPTNLAAVALQGIDIDSIGQANTLPRTVQHGCLEVLDDPRHTCRPWLLRNAMRLKRPTPFQAMLFDAPHLAFRIPAKDLPPPLPVEPNPEDAPPPDDGAGAADEVEDEFAFPAPRQQRAGPPPGLMVGAELRRNLALWPDEVINVVSPFGELGPEGPVPKSRPFHLAGWFASGMLEFDTKLAYAGLAAVQRFMGLGDVAGAVQIRVDDLENARAVRDRLRAALPGTLRVTDWQERNRNLFSALKLEKIAMFLVLTINILLAAFSITSTLVMTIIERKREVAILMAMGSSNGSVVRIFMAQGAFTGALGSALGSTIGLGLGLTLATLGLPLNTDVYYISAIPVDVRALDVVAIIVVALLVSLASTIYPARYASRLRPVEGLNAE